MTGATDPGPNRQQRQFSVSVRHDLYQWLTDLAETRQSSIAQICREALIAYRDQQP